MALERERKFLLKKDKFDEDDYFKHVFIQQGYLLIEGDSHLRVRITNEEIGEVTFKSLISNTDRNEINYPTSLEEAKKLMETTKRRLVKNRYSKWIGDIKIDVDIYPNGLSVVEIEYKTDELPVELIPDFCGYEITGIEEYSNLYIAIKNSEIDERQKEKPKFFDKPQPIKLKKTLSDDEVRKAFQIVFVMEHSLGFMRAELNQLFTEETYWFMEKVNVLWYDTLIKYLKSIDYDINSLRINSNLLVK